ncbi:hypothetical protein ACRAWF_03940 [Streptomyces sp. L7]
MRFLEWRRRRNGTALGAAARYRCGRTGRPADLFVFAGGRRTD